MHKLVLAEVVKVVRLRSEKDCPAWPKPYTFETLENAILDLAAEVDKLSAKPGLIPIGYVCHGCEVPCRIDTGGKPFDMSRACCHEDGTTTGTNWQIVSKQV